jgi:hypothetical protein
MHKGTERSSFICQCAPTEEYSLQSSWNRTETGLDSSVVGHLCLGEDNRVLQSSFEGVGRSVIGEGESECVDLIRRLSVG